MPNHIISFFQKLEVPLFWKKVKPHDHEQLSVTIHIKIWLLYSGGQVQVGLQDANMRQVGLVSVGVHR